MLNLKPRPNTYLSIISESLSKNPFTATLLSVLTSQGRGLWFAERQIVPGYERIKPINTWSGMKYEDYKKIHVQ